MDSKPRILLVDDSPAYRRVIQTMLGPKYDFMQAESAEDALARVGAFMPDLVISDLIMPGLDGYELCKRLRAQPGLESVPIIMLTSKTGDESRITGLEVGADDYLFKPIRPRELNARVGSLLRLRRATMELATANATLKKAQAELVRAEKLASLGQLVAGIAHELNNPLNYIYGNTEFLSDYMRTFMELLDRYETELELTPAQREHIARWKRRRISSTYAPTSPSCWRACASALSGRPRSCAGCAPSPGSARASSWRTPTWPTSSTSR